ncbi:MAG: TolC family protein [Bacteroidota bacterium]
MKNYLLFVFLLFFEGISHAQQRNLNFYVETAKNNSPLNNKNKNEIINVKLDLKQIKNVLGKPDINLEANVLFAPIISHDNNTSRFNFVTSDAKSYTGFDLANTDGGQYQALVTLKQQLFTASKYRSFSAKADIMSQQFENNISLNKHEIEQLVCNQYLLCLKSKKQSEISDELLRELQNQLLILKQLAENAIYKQTDVLLLQIELKDFELESKTFQNEYEENQYDLNILCGLNDTNKVDLQDIKFFIKTKTTSASQFLMSYKLDSLNLLMDQKVSELKYQPQLSFFANAGLNAVYQPTFNRLGFSTGLTFTWNLFDGHQRMYQREKTLINQQTIQFEKNNFQIQNEMYRSKILNHLQKLDQKIALTDDQIKQYEALMEVYRKELSAGELSVMDLKNIVKDMAAKKQNNVLLKMEKQSLINSYNYWNF